MSTSHTKPAALHDEVRQHYAQAATAPGLSCCGPTGELQGAFGSSLYSGNQTASLPEGAVLASLGCGNPLSVASLRDGDRVLDLGSGGGIDVLLAAEKVGPTGLVFGVDMTPEMLDLARRNAAEAGAANVEFRAGTTEDVPLPDGIARALSTAEYLEGLAAAGFVDASVELTHEVGDGLHGAIIRAAKPSEGRLPAPRAAVEDADPSPARCCAPDEQETCCATSDKAACCGTPAGGGGSCGCR